LVEIIVIIVLYVIGAAVGSSEFGIFLAFVGLTIGAVRRHLLKRKVEQQREALEKRFSRLESALDNLRASVAALAALTGRVYRLEQEAGVEPKEAAKAAPPAPAVPRPAPPAPAPAPPVAPAAPAPVPPAAPASPAPAPPVAATPPKTAPVVPSIPPPVPPPAPTPTTVARVTSSVAAPLPKKKPERIGLEEKLGTNWLNKVGIVILVFGIAFLLATAVRALGPAGKIALGYAVSVVMLGVGTFFERRERYRLLSSAAIGGGWALAFFTTYAMHHVPAAQVLQSQAIDLVLMLAVAAGMVAHTLHYRSQVVTGLAFLLAFSTVTISHVSVYSLVAGAILALALVIIVNRMRWYELEVLGILAGYLNHFYWLRPIIEPMGDARHVFPEFLPSAALLIFYWAVFRGSYIVRRVERKSEENVSTAAALLNSFGLLTLMKYQSVRPDLAFWFLLGLGAVELLLALLPVVRRRRMAFAILATLGATLLVAAFPFRYSYRETQLSVLWLMEAEALFLAGVLSRESIFRRLGMLASVVTAAQVVLTQSYHAGSDLRRSIIFAVAAVLFHADAHLIPQRWPRWVSGDAERLYLRCLGYLAAGMGFAAVWVGLPDPWVAVGWAALALVLGLAGTPGRIRDLHLQQYVLAAAALARVLAVNTDLVPVAGHVNLRLLTLGLTAALLYLGAGWCGEAGQTGSKLGRMAHNTSASLLLALLAWYEAPEAWVAVAWIGLALVLVVVGSRFLLSELVISGDLLALAAVVRVLAINLESDATWHGVSLRLVTVGLTVGGIYLLSRWSSLPGRVEAGMVPDVFTWAGSLLVLMLLWYELRPVSVALGWALFGLVLLELGLARRATQLRLQAYAALTAAFLRIFFVNLNAAGVAGQISPRFYTVVSLAVAFYYVYGRLQGRADSFLAVERRVPVAAVHAWFGMASVAALMRFELDRNLVVAAWAGLVVALIALAWWSDRRVFLFQGLVMSAAVLFRGAFSNLMEAGLGTVPGRLLHVGGAAALLFLSLAFAFPLHRRAQEKGDPGWTGFLSRHPEQVLFFVPLALLSGLLAVEMRQGFVTIAWGVEGAAAFLFALWVKQRSFRLAGLGLLLLCVGKILIVDAWRLQGSYRYLTFVVLGCLLLLVSFLYSRHREVFRQYL
jgi:hypothetical protein